MNVASSASYEHQPADQRLADPERQLERLVRLDRADDAREHAQHAALGAARGELGRRRLREEAAVARALERLEDGRLALEAVDRPVDDRDPVPDRRVVDEVARREVVGAVDDHVPALVEDRVDVLGREPLVVGDDVHVRVEAVDALAGRLDLRAPERLGRVQHLALQVRVVDVVGVDDAERPDAGGRQVERGRGAEPAGADEQHAAVEQALLALLADLRDQQVAAVAADLVAVERARDDGRVAGLLPGDDPALDVDRLRVAKRLERPGRTERALAAAAVEEHGAAPVGRDGCDRAPRRWPAGRAWRPRDVPGSIRPARGCRRAPAGRRRTSSSRARATSTAVMSWEATSTDRE